MNNYSYTSNKSDSFSGIKGRMGVVHWGGDQLVHKLIIAYYNLKRI